MMFNFLMVNLTCSLGSEDESNKTAHQAEFSLLLAALIQRSCVPHNPSVSFLLSECVKNNTGVIVISDDSQYQLNSYIIFGTQIYLQPGKIKHFDMRIPFLETELLIFADD